MSNETRFIQYKRSCWNWNSFWIYKHSHLINWFKYSYKRKQIQNGRRVNMDNERCQKLNACFSPATKPQFVHTCCLSFEKSSSNPNSANGTQQTSPNANITRAMIPTRAQLPSPVLGSMRVTTSCLQFTQVIRSGTSPNLCGCVDTGAGTGSVPVGVY